MEESKIIEATQPKKKKSPVGKIIFLLLICVAAFFIWRSHEAKQSEIEANTVRYEEVMNDPYTEEDIIILDAVREIQTYAEFLVANPDDESFHRAKGLILRLHGFFIEDLDLKNVPLAIGGAVVVDTACHGILFDDLSDKGKLEYISICKEIYATLGAAYELFDVNSECYEYDKSLDDFRIVREPEEVEEPPKELTATQQKIAEWKEAFLAWSAEVQAKNRERFGY